MSGPLDAFSPPVRGWFQETFGEPTPPQAAGWPPIQRGEHTLILAPTGSGKTLAAFLWGIDELYRGTTNDGRRTTNAGQRSSVIGPPSSVGGQSGVRLLYISPLKALNNDIERNLRAPLAGIREVAARLGQELPPLKVAVRTGDTPSHLRAAMLKQPPDILITTPESFYLLLTSPRARDLLRTVATIIVDEIHTLCGNKRGAHLALSLERLEHLAGRPIQHIGLSATVKPLEEAARFLGGQVWMNDERRTTADERPTTDDGGRTAAGSELWSAVNGHSSFVVGRRSVPRPVTIVNTGYRKPLDLQVVTVVEDFRNLPGDSVWPTVIPAVLADIMRHRSTLIFANNRRLAERTADRLNAQIAGERSEEIPPGSTEILAPGGIMRDRGLFALGAEGPIQAHHGSMAKEARRKMEEDLKAGRLPALVGTSSLELGIDIGAVDLVVQLQSPKSVAQGLQRVGRSGHLVGQTSRGRIYATFREDLVEAAAVARGMAEGDVEPTATPRNPLDVLAQQVVAMVAVEDWRATELFDRVRQAYPYRDLSPAAWQGVLDMLSGGFDALDGPRHGALKARIAWDRTNDRLAALPGTRLLAITNAGTISDTGAYDVYLPDGKTRVGQLDEEFVFETRVGDVFLLGSNTWRVLEVADDRIVVGEAAGVTPRMPFWHGDYPWRPFELGQRVGRLRREVAEKLRGVTHAACGVPAHENTRSTLSGAPPGCGGAESKGAAMPSAAPASFDCVRQTTPDSAQDASAGISRAGQGSSEALIQWLRREYLLDVNSARNLVDHVQRQLDAVGVISTDKTIVVETFPDAVGEMRMVVHSPFGGRVNGAWALALSAALRERAGVAVETQVSDDGILLRFPAAPADWSPADIVQAMTPAEARRRILAELPHSAVFGAHFRMNAARALLLPRARGGKRTPFWLQRLKAKDLLAVVGRLEDFPIVAETYRDCLRDVLDLERLDQVLAAIQEGTIRVAPIETVVPSPVAAGLLYNFISVYMYEWDAPKAERQLQSLALRRDLVDDLLTGATSGQTPLKPEALAEVAGRAGHLAPGSAARSADELAVFFMELGDLTTGEALARCAGDGKAWLAQLADQGRIIEIAVPTPTAPATRWIPVELADPYRATDWGVGPGAEAILRRYLRISGPITRAALLARYAFDEYWLDETLARLIAAREVVQGHFTQDLLGPVSDRAQHPLGPVSDRAQHPLEPVSDRAQHPLGPVSDRAQHPLGPVSDRAQHPLEPVSDRAQHPLGPVSDRAQHPLGPVSDRAPTEYCDRGIFEQLYRRTVALLRREVQPVSLAAYADFLIRWQGVGAAAAGSDGLRRIMGQLCGLALPGVAWERDVLPARLAAYRAGELDALCASGELVWVCAGADGRRARVRFFGRGEGGLFLGPAPEPAPVSLSETGRAAYAFLRTEGASFVADLQTGLRLPPAAVRSALAELALAGLVTGDSLAALHAVLSHTPDATAERPPLSALEAELASRLPPRTLVGPPSRDRYHAAKRRVAERLRAEFAAEDPLGDGGASWAGRWSPVHRAAVIGPPLSAEERANRLARIALARHGVVTQELLGRIESRAVAGEELPWEWSELYGQLQRMELRGEVRRGYFIAGLSGVQYALPEAVERLRAARTAEDDTLTVLDACDPANIYGGELGSGYVPDEARSETGPSGGNLTPSQARSETGPSTEVDSLLPGREGGGSSPVRFARVPSTHCVLWRGRPVLVAEDNGTRLTVAADVEAAIITRALAAYLNRPAAPRRLTVEEWNDAPVLGSAGEPLLKALAFSRTPSGMERWADR